ncbi:MAG: DUF4124 domain-containing protein [Betaproteobacteria bacterium]
MKQRVFSWLFAVLAMAPGANAQTMYKSTLPDGKVVYGEKPEPGAKQVDKVTPPPAQTGTKILTPAEQQKIDQRMKQRTAQDDLDRRRLESAYQQLKKAEAARETGKEPLPGERLGTATGASRLTDEYWARQKSLEAAVEAARRQVEQAEQAARR